MYQIYQIKYGDSLESIANKFNTTLKDLQDINSNLNISAGNYIVVPVNNDDIFMTYTVKSGDSLYKIAQNYDISVDDLASINGIKKNDYIYPNQELVVPTGKALVYITKENDTIENLKNNFNEDYDTILRQNKKIYLVPDQLVILKREENEF